MKMLSYFTYQLFSFTQNVGWRCVQHLVLNLLWIILYIITNIRHIFPIGTYSYVCHTNTLKMTSILLNLNLPLLITLNLSNSPYKIHRQNTRSGAEIREPNNRNKLFACALKNQSHFPIAKNFDQIFFSKYNLRWIFIRDAYALSLEPVTLTGIEQRPQLSRSSVVWYGYNEVRSDPY